MSDRSLYYASKLLAQTGQNLLWAALFVAAGNWQRDRMHAKEDARAALEARA